jgi:hypothetical protein
MICRSDGENSGGRRSGKVVGMGCTLGTHPARYEIEAFLSRQRAHREVGLRSGIAGGFGVTWSIENPSEIKSTIIVSSALCAVCAIVASSISAGESQGVGAPSCEYRFVLQERGTCLCSSRLVHHGVHEETNAQSDSSHAGCDACSLRRLIRCSSHPPQEDAPCNRKVREADDDSTSAVATTVPDTGHGRF